LVCKLEVHRPVEALEELHALQRDLAELGDAVAVALLERAERCFLAWEMDKGERLLEQALNRVQKTLQQPEPALGGGVARYFNTCALVTA
jgi:hypothetical protein